MKKSLFATLLIALFSSAVLANSSPSVRNVSVSQRTDGSKKVDIYYNLSDADGDTCTISVEVSDDGGSTWDIIPVTFEVGSDVGTGITPDSGKHIVWDCGADLPGEYGTNYRVKVIADDGVVDGPDGMVWVYINDSGAGMKDYDGNPISYGGFTGEMSKYETTNAQYCEFLNAALASEDITVSSNRVYGANGSNGGADFVGEVYFDTSNYVSYSQITWNGTSFSVRSRDGYDMNNHPAVQVSWYGATAFCNYYGFRLPTEWEWQAVADHYGEFTYGCGTTIDFSKANYYDSGFANPLGLSSYPYTSPVDHYSSYGYGMNDMAGNVWEWTSSLYDPQYSSRVIRGGSWAYYADGCTVSYRGSFYPNDPHDFLGFRVCR